MLELKRFIIGRALRTEQAAHERLAKKTALAVFSSDALSSTAYATEEILLVLAVAAVYGQAGAFRYVVPISIGIGVLLVIVTAIGKRFTPTLQAAVLTLLPKKTSVQMQA